MASVPSIPTHVLIAIQIHDEAVKKYVYDGSQVGFMDLSPELRNVIYGLCLTTRTKIRIAIVTKLPPRQQRWFNWDAQPSEMMCPNLLATCKMIHNEATPVLYGSNHFILPPFSEIARKWYGPGLQRLWTREIGDSVKYLRAITLCGAGIQRDLVLVLESLAPVRMLDVLVVGHSCWCNFTIEKTMAKGLLPLMLQLRRKRKDIDKKSILDALEFAEREVPSYQHNWRAYRIPLTLDAAKVKAILKEELDGLE